MTSSGVSGPPTKRLKQTCLSFGDREGINEVGIFLSKDLFVNAMGKMAECKKSASHDNSMLFGAHGMQVQTTPSDGNCLFSAISLQLMLCGINKSAATVRAELVSFMSQNQDKLLRGVQTVFRSGRTISFEWRQQQLSRLLQMLDEQKDEFVSALQQDLNKSKYEAVIMELGVVRQEVVHALNNLSEWMKSTNVEKDMVTMFDDAYVKYEPFGVVLVIGAWNYPVQLTLGPAVGALAAGNCVILKPSEVSEHTAALLNRLCPLYFDKEAVQVVNGGIPETTELLKQRFDYIFYTGSSLVAKIIYEAAAKYLTPVTLELGGKSPVFVDESCDLDLVSRRLMWGKFTNCAQTCIAPDYVLCTPGVQAPLIERCKTALESFYGSDPKSSDSYGRIINNRHFNRIKKLLDSTSGRVAVGGDVDEGTNYISPTLLSGVEQSDVVMKDEIFGPILPFIDVKDVEDAIEFINSGEKPLALYVFSKHKHTVDKIVSHTSSGGVCVNDTLMQMSVISLPFGGVGNSGLGAYHGKYSFDTFSHKRSCLVRAQNLEKMNDMVRYPPYNEKKIGLASWLTKKTLKSDKILGIFPRWG